MPHNSTIWNQADAPMQIAELAAALTGADTLQDADPAQVARLLGDAVAVAFFSASEAPTDRGEASRFVIEVSKQARGRHSAMVAAASAWLDLQEIARRGQQRGH